MTATPDGVLWASALVALVVSAGVLGGRRAVPVLLWVVAYFWVQIVCDLLAANLAGHPVAGGILGAYQAGAIVLSLWAMVALAVGMRLGLLAGVKVFGRRSGPGDASAPRSVSLVRAIIVYFAILSTVQAVDIVAGFVPTLAQPVLALHLLRFVSIYLVSAKVAEARRGYIWLMIIIAFEIASGMLTYFSTYKEPVFVMLLAFAGQVRGRRGGEWVVAAAALLAIVWISVVWSGIKQEYRSTVIREDLRGRVSWMVGKYTDPNIDYRRSAEALLDRAGYTKFYALVLMREDQKALGRGQGYYWKALEHILTPRVLFPDKAALNDSTLTSQLLGIQISQKTSIGIGYVAQAHVDFGFPGLLAPLAAIGALMGFVAQYFTTRLAPPVVSSAFATAALLVAFRFETNIDKALGGFLVGVLVLALVLRFVYPQLAGWLSVQAPSSRSGSGLRRSVGRRIVAPR